MMRIRHFSEEFKIKIENEMIMVSRKNPNGTKLDNKTTSIIKFLTIFLR